MSGPAVRVLLAGFSGIGDQDHQSAMYLPALRAHPDVDIVGVAASCAADRPLATKAAAELDLPLHEDIESALDSCGANVVSVAVPLDQRADVITAAVCAGNHVLADKPLAADTAEVDRIAAALTDGTVLVPALHQRYRGAVRAGAAAVRAGRVGLPWNVQADFVVAGGPDAPGGELRNLGPYPVDVLHALLGLDAVRVYARCTDAENVATLCIDYTHGVTATVVVGRTGPVPDVPAAAPIQHRYRISGSHGLFDVDATKPALDVRGADGSTRRWVGPDTVALLVADLVRAVTTGAAPSVGIDEARHVHRVLDAAAESIRRGRPVPVADTREAHS